MLRVAMTIDGREVEGVGTHDVINPATELVVGKAPDCSAQHLDSAVAAAKRAFPSWSADDDARRTALAVAGERVKGALESIAQTLTLEQGKPLSHAKGELIGALSTLKALTQMPWPFELLQDDAKARIELHHRPFGVVAAITPWNFPLLIAMSKLAPALRAGNTVVLKPSPYTPLSTLQLVAEFARALPPGVVNVVGASNEVGGLLVAHPDVRCVSFTGSVATGRSVGEVAARGLKRAVLELGGNDPAIVLDDADVDQIAVRLFWSAFMNSGQICLAVKRVYVHEALASRLTAALVKLAKTVVVGDGMDPQTQMGPVNNAMQLQRVSFLIEDAVKRGGQVHCGGERLQRKGYFMPPTIISGLGDDAPLVAEEQFGPVLPLLTFREVDDAVERANGTPFGLGASVWSSDTARASAVAARLDAGTVWVNQHLALSGKAPFGGAKCSGVGYASGRWGLESFLQKHVLNVAP